MTQEDKELLLKDLCARLPYGVIVGYSTKDNPNTLDKIGEIIYIDMRFGMIQMQIESGISYGLPPSEFIKPYLRPMSSMTEEERNEYLSIKMQEMERVALAEVYRPEAISEIMDWLNKHHFDYCRLIEKGLALEAPKGIYK